MNDGARNMDEPTNTKQFMQFNGQNRQLTTDGTAHHHNCELSCLYKEGAEGAMNKPPMP